MFRRPITFALALAAAGTLAASSQAGLISILASKGAVDGTGASIFRVDTDSGIAKFTQKAADAATGSDTFSPNALGNNGKNYFYTTFNTDYPDTEDLYRGAATLLKTSISKVDNSVAGGDAVGSTFYFVNANGSLGTVTGIDGAPGTQGVSTKAITGLGSATATLGDLAVSGTTGYLSFNGATAGSGKIAVIDLTTAAATLYDIDPDLSPTPERFVGLSFGDDGKLYGVKKNGAQNFGIYLLEFDGSVFTQTFKSTVDGSTITGLGDNWEITDAARPAAVPEPATLALFGLSTACALPMIRRFRTKRTEA